LNKVKVRDFDYDGYIIPELEVILDDSGCIVLLPTLYSLFLRLRQIVYKQKKRPNKRGEIKINLVESDITEQTVEQYTNYLFKYLQFIEDIAKDKSNAPSVHISEAASQAFVNYYINRILVKERGVGSSSVKSQISALLGYYNWLANAGLCSLLNIYLEPANKEISERNTKRKQALKYISTHGRFELLKNCSTIRDELLIRMGYEVGLRTKENLGLVLNDFTYNKQRKKGLLSLFEEMESDKDKKIEQFEYFLAGKFTKATRNSGEGGRSRAIYFNRSLLERMREYYLTERDQIMDSTGLVHETLFVKTDNITAGCPISSDTATDRFKVLSEDIAGIHEENSYHDLRHTFGTNLFHEEIKGEPAINIGLNHPAILSVAKRLGHKIEDPKATASVTRMYIRMHSEMMQMENIDG